MLLMRVRVKRMFAPEAILSVLVVLCTVSSPSFVRGQLVDSTADASIDSDPPTQVMAGLGIMAGEVTDTSAIVQLRLTKTAGLVDGDIAGADGVVEFLLVAEGNESLPQIKTMRAEAETDHIARAHFSGLTAGSRYRCTARIGSDESALQNGPTLTFKTLPGKERSATTQFAVITGMKYARFYGTQKKRKAKQNANTGANKHPGYPALKTIRVLKPDFFVGTGDNVYYDNPKETRAKTVSQMRQKWHEQFVQPRFLNLFATVPAYWMVDDHDYRVDDCDNSGDYLPTAETALKTLLEQLPYGPANAKDVKTYRTVRVSQELQIWFTENRLFRSANKLPDGPDKTIWGAEQKEWLKNTLVESDAQFKILISPTPMVGPDDLRKKDNHCNIGGFQHERDEFFKFLKGNGLDQQNFFIVCGDRHWQYHAVDQTGVEEFSCGALIDANSRLGRNPGDPNSTDPNGLIKQPYTQAKRSGGFLMVRCEPDGKTDRASLEFTFYDEKGTVLHTCTK